MGSLFMPHSIPGNPLTGLRFLRRQGESGRLHAALVISRVSMRPDRSEAEAREQEGETRGSQKGRRERKASERPGAAL